MMSRVGTSSILGLGPAALSSIDQLKIRGPHRVPFALTFPFKRTRHPANYNEFTIADVSGVPIGLFKAIR